MQEYEVAQMLLRYAHKVADYLEGKQSFDEVSEERYFEVFKYLSGYEKVKLKDRLKRIRVNLNRRHAN